MKNKKNIIIIIVVLILLVIVVDLVLYKVNKTSKNPVELEENATTLRYSCFTDNTSENEIGKLVEKYDFEYLEKEQKIINYAKKVEIQFFNQDTYNSHKENSNADDWYNEVPNSIENDDNTLTIRYIWNIIYNEGDTIPLNDYIDKLASMKYTCEKLS